MGVAVKAAEKPSGASKPVTRLDDRAQVTFGVTANSRQRILSWGALLSGVVAAAIHLSGNAILWWVFWATFMALLLPLGLVGSYGRNELVIDFAEDSFTYQVRFDAEPQFVQGRLADIVAIHIERHLFDGTFVFTTSLVFHEDVKQPPFRMDNWPCSVPLRNFRDHVQFCVELARRLNIPLYDDSGWQDGESPILDPPGIVIRPGDPHPALKH